MTAGSGLFIHPIPGGRRGGSATITDGHRTQTRGREMAAIS